MSKDRNYYFINAITLYRLVAAPVMVWFIFSGNFNFFKWMLPLSFFTDLIDGYLARRFKVSSVFGSRLDSIADDLTILAGIIGLFVFKYWFIKENIAVVVILIVLLVIQNCMALIRYGKISSFHTYSAKVAAIVQGSFLILIFLLPEPIYPLFYAAALVSAIDLLEEIVLVILIPTYQINVRGLYWLMKEKKS